MKKRRESRLWWLLPAALALPFAAAVGLILLTRGQRLNEMLEAAIKLAVIP